MKIIIYISIIITSFLTISCNKENTSVNSKATSSTKKTIPLPKNLKIIKIDESFKAPEYTYQNLSLSIPEDFKKKEETIFFQENGTNLSIAKELTQSSIDDYIKKNYKKLKTDYSNTIKEEENLNINNNLAKHVKYIIDRKKYLIQIETILIKKDNYMYIIIVSGKKKHIDVLSNTINNIFATIKIKDI